MINISHFLIKKVFITAFFITLPWKYSPQVIIFFGDSITAGYGLPVAESFPTLVEISLKHQGKDIKIINAGLSGETSAGGLNRINWILQQSFDIFVLELGGNDALRGLPIWQIKANLQAIIDKVRTQNPVAIIVLAGMLAPPNLGEEYTTAFKNIYPLLAKKNNITLIPFLLKGVGGDPRLNLPDGIHPNTEGHQIVANTVSKTIMSLLK